MAYYGTTAASSLTNVPARIGGFVGGGANTTAFGVAAGLGAKSIWLYNSSNQSSEMTGANFFTDALQLGMKQGDIVISAVATGSSVSVAIGVLSSVTTNGANLASTGGIISSTR